MSDSSGNCKNTKRENAMIKILNIIKKNQELQNEIEDAYFNYNLKKRTEKIKLNYSNKSRKK